MDVEARVEERIRKPVGEVFEAIVDPERMSKYFITGASGPMRAGTRVEWEFADVGVKRPTTARITAGPFSLMTEAWCARRSAARRSCSARSRACCSPSSIQLRAMGLSSPLRRRPSSIIPACRCLCAWIKHTAL